MTMTIPEALKELDPLNDDHWTADGMPRVDVVANLHGADNISRADITNAAPDFTRHSAMEAAAASTVVAENATDEAGSPGPVPVADANEVAPETEQENADGDTSEEGQEAEAEASEEVTNADAAHAQALAEEGTEEAPEATPDEGREDDPEEAAPDEVSVTEPFAKAEVEAAPPVQFTELEKLEGELAEATEIMTYAQRYAEEAKTESDRASDAVNTLNRRIEVLHKSDPNHGTAGVRAYLKQQNENRMMRAKGLQRFVESTGVAMSDIGTAINPKSPIDQAMNQRNPKRGSARPNYKRT